MSLDEEDVAAIFKRTKLVAFRRGWSACLAEVTAKLMGDAPLDAAFVAKVLRKLKRIPGPDRGHVSEKDSSA